MKTCAAAFVLSLILSVPAWAQSSDPSITAAVTSASRPADDVARDAVRKPAALLAFSHIKAGKQVADLMPGGGYFTRLFSAVVGPHGHVYAVVPAELAQVFPASVTMANAIGGPAFANVSALIQPTASLDLPEPLDLAWTSDNYHDLFAFFGADKAAAFDQAVFKALKPGGIFVVIDHVGVAGSDPKKLHRIDPAIVKAQILAAGFRLEAESPILANPADSHAEPVFAPGIRGKTDQFVLRFRKPG